ncbi:MAG: formyl transferase [Chitinophagaceae bacterium]
MEEKPEIVLLAIDCDTTRIVYHYLKQYFTFEKVIIEDKPSRKELIKRRVKKLGIKTVAGQLLFQTIGVKYISFGSKKRIHKIIQANNLNLKPIDEKVVTRVQSVNTAEAKQVLLQVSTKLVVVNGTRIIAKNILQGVQKTFINTHLGVTPYYRGVHGGYWALVNSDKGNFGATVHLVDAGIDTGSVLCHAKAQPSAEDNFVTYPYLQIAAVLPCIKQVIEKVIDGKIQVQNVPKGNSRLFSHPTLWQYFYHRLVKGVK